MFRAKSFRIIGLLLVLVLALAACGGTETAADDTADTADTTDTTEPATSDVSSEPMESEMSTEMSSEMAGAECELEPAAEASDGAATAEQPAATVASENPNLSTLAQAVEAAGLVETLNSEGPFTIFAPANCAFEAIPEEDLNALLEDTDALTNVLTYHVVQGDALTAEDLAGMDSVTTVQGDDVAIAPEGDTLSLNDGQATVIQPDVEVSNGVVHIIDGVLMPSS